MLGFSASCIRDLTVLFYVGSDYWLALHLKNGLSKPKNRVCMSAYISQFYMKIITNPCHNERCFRQMVSQVPVDIGETFPWGSRIICKILAWNGTTPATPFMKINSVQVIANDYICFMWDLHVITHPCPDMKSVLSKLSVMRGWMNIYILWFCVDVITYSGR